MQLQFFEVDVFATSAFSGNPLAVVAHADGLSTQQMQAIAHWTNFSETTFLLEPTDPAADYRVRIFTPHEEFDFAGHPTLGSAAVWRALGNKPQKEGTIVQECGVGMVSVRESGRIYSFATPPLRASGPLSSAELAEACAGLNIAEADVIDSAWVDNGPGWRLLQLRDAAAVRAVQPAATRPKVGVVGMCNSSAGTDSAAYEVRAFTAGFEDPVTGSFNGGAAQFMRSRGLVPARYTACQGSQLGRDGEVFIHDDGADIWVGGRVHIRVQGKLEV
ncbi:PhzF family phenazine biosynthesis protein [Corynebacterium sp. ACRQM]|uniref:PhzF family phenazine biosynthesis protein n=1 Tax=unclassified Corynebacterium TaxID=2624378 RepID=UPI001EF6359F|nr:MULTISPECIES: PhzF family phenazine biosynthesis protein [unclassified Corynebacterium]MCG7243435.1 PhzF family phenazine biosynthesis protein [Corynebacterium sp. ACRPS]MCG7271494.1 PhzF family phenazine biosynthesis protein [Corynebacterium sp. ACRQM]MCG7233980.1 PhzF family phenazine biosynthesis protein [Corynebacterium sp. ACRPR]MDK8473760.1 PhzF family phenazine biosynthesis protein [Corynebacterium sp. MSK078]MDK8813864.1 PhzF family phenazine biosynthesis protein [Corynebacterium sp